ncbi:hypothetical protein NNJEOMEG_01184 [Fundidesulfovibrio magnetotacticus]|uniref:Phospholipase A2 n=1 Tax=Fundidesulfovibrio magnetotacticus TaxID=2730080 RepID=A0A6V8LKX6_9BACT|nr:hypothetical protein [Fundidesulfovibrio magnetotacticus]GFK93352.1 hypothetical protein NNJEOMEG_01184 [Fundidesulfovibrio magnetotacticus]
MNTLRALLTASLLFCALPASAQVTTLAQQEAVWNQLIQATGSDPAQIASKALDFVPQYGNWCGTQTTAASAVPIDCVDQACKEHDLSVAYSSAKATQAQIVQADRAFIGALTFSQASTPYGELYRTLAVDLFEWKTTFEQANNVSLVVNCTDCKTLP